MSFEDLELDIRSCLESLDSNPMDKIPEKKKVKPKKNSGRRLRSEDKDSSDVQIIEQPKSIRLLKISTPNKKKQQKFKVKLSQANKKARSQRQDDFQPRNQEKEKNQEKQKNLEKEREKEKEEKISLIMMSLNDFISNWQSNMRKMLEFSTKLKNELSDIQQSQKKKDKK